MSVFATIRRAAAIGGLAVATTLLTGCLFQPGTFDSTMTVREDGTFRFTYDGEIVMAGIAQLADMAAQAEAGEPPEPCTDEQTLEERPCTQAELGEREAKARREREMFDMMMGGVDLGDPEIAAEAVATLERQAGWNSVEVTGDDVFRVSFAIESRLTHDFDFPTFEDMPMGNAFVVARRRDAERVRIVAPGFAAQGGNPFASLMMMGMAGAMSEANEADGAAPPPPSHPMEGRFRIITDAPILANNTDEGPADTASGQVLSWEVTPDTRSAPTALLQLQL